MQNYRSVEGFRFMARDRLEAEHIARTQYGGSGELIDPPEAARASQLTRTNDVQIDVAGIYALRKAAIDAIRESRAVAGDGARDGSMRDIGDREEARVGSFAYAQDAYARRRAQVAAYRAVYDR